MKVKTYLVVVLILESEEGGVLLGLRQNTQFEDNKWAFPGGHVEEGEEAKEALCREALEEIGVFIHPEELQVVHVYHRAKSIKQDNHYIDIFMKCNKYNGVIVNKEPEKCGGLKFFPLNNLPENMIEYMKIALQNIEEGKIYDEAA